MESGRGGKFSDNQGGRDLVGNRDFFVLICGRALLILESGLN